MIILDTTTRSLEILLGAVPTAQLPWTATYSDHTLSTYAPASVNGITNSTTPVTVVAAPAASTQRQIRMLSVYNVTLINQTVTIQYNDNTTTRIILKVTLSAGDTLFYVDGNGFQTLAASGEVKSEEVVSLLAGGALSGSYPNPSLLWPATSMVGVTGDVSTTTTGFSTPDATPWVTLLQVDGGSPLALTISCPQDGMFGIVLFSMLAHSAVSPSGAAVQLTLDGVAVGEACNFGPTATSAFGSHTPANLRIMYRLPFVTKGSHVVGVQWKSVAAGAATLTCYRATIPAIYNGTLVVQSLMS